MQASIKRVEIALAELKNGNMVILIDDPDRENEGDLIALAENITPKNMNMMIHHGSGIVCLSMTEARLNELNLPLMLPASHNTSCRGTPFTISIDARDGITTGVSAEDRTKTIQVAYDDKTTPDQLVKPGHIFPLQARDGGVFERQGHTEGALDLAVLAGSKPAAVLCEIMNPDGSMTRGKQLDDFAKEHNLHVLAISDIIEYRLQHENMVVEETSATVPLDNYGTFKMTVIKEKFTNQEHMILTSETVPANNKPLLVRIHSACVTGDIFSSQRCDCHQQLHYSLKRISEEGGMLIYLNQEGRGIGLFNKIKAYALQENGLDTVEANEKLGLPADLRQYHIAANILRNHNVPAIRLLTNNPDKVNSLKKHGFENVEREAMPIFQNEHNEKYLKTKKEKLKHDINLNHQN
ncbi:MAG: 3,4-dihydroxy-2-butanone-4-phosphate synthase [Gammaproteobacteria bacterium]